MTSNSEYRSGWTTVPLSSVCDVRDGTHESPKYHLRGVPLVTSKYMRDGKIYPHEAPLISPQDARRINSRSKVDRGDVLLSMIGTVGNAVLVSDVPDYCIKNMALLKPQNILPEFLIHFVNGPIFQRRVEDGSSGGIQSFISLGKLRSTLIDLPSLDEQRSIAAMLNDAERFIEDQKQLIAKKQAIKTGMMQQLLTGKMRMPGFDVPWKTITLGNHVNYVKNVALSRAQLDESSMVKYLHYGDIHTTKKLKINPSVQDMPRAKAELLGTARFLVKGDLVFADASEDPAGVGKSVEIVDVPENGVVPGLHTITARFDKTILADGFKAYLQFIPAFRDQLLRLAAGTKVLATNRSNISGIEIDLPGIKEQQAIARILDDADAEISALESRLEKAKAIKQGMMQELLTGKTRLVGEVVAS